MIRNVWTHFKETHLGLFICLSSIFVVFPHLAHQEFARLLLCGVLTASILLSLARRAAVSVALRVTHAFAGIAATVLTWSLAVLPAAESIAPTAFAVFFGLSVVVYFRNLIANPEVDTDTLLGAVCTYVLIGLFFAACNTILLQFDPACISLPADGGERLYQVVYFSFVTLTTLGYGDAVPVTHATQMLAAYEAIVGQIFVTFIAGMLIGNHVSNRKRGRSNATSEQ